MSTGTSFSADPELSDFQTDIIINYKKFFFRIDLVIFHQTTDTLSTQVHISLRLHKKHFLSLDHSFSDEGTVFFSIDCYLVFLRQAVHHIKSNIMSCPLILFIRVSKSCNYKHSIHLCFFSFLILLNPFSFVTHFSCINYFFFSYSLLSGITCRNSILPKEVLYEFQNKNHRTSHERNYLYCYFCHFRYSHPLPFILYVLRRPAFLCIRQKIYSRRLYLFFYTRK